MREHLGFLKTSSAVVKIAAWIFLSMGVLSSILTFTGRIPSKNPVIDSIANLALSTFSFFLFFLVAKIADLLIKIINEIKKE